MVKIKNPTYVHFKFKLLFLSFVSIEPEEDIDHMLDQIFNDVDVTFPQLLNLWKSTTNYRLNDIQQLSDTNNIIGKWKSYMQPMGFKLVSSFFIFKYYIMLTI